MAPIIRPITTWCRSRAIVVGALVALSTVIGASVVNVAGADPAPGAGVFVPIVPCRLFDTRSGADNVGPRSTPLGQQGSYAQAVVGANGNCAIPTSAVAVAMNVTVVNPTADSYLTLWPADAERPLASNLNWVAGGPPIPNKVDVRLSADGRVSLFNNAGTVDVLADVVGYYTAHDHDDRYFTKDETYSKDQTYSRDETYSKDQIDAALATKADAVTAGLTTVVVGAAAFSPVVDTDGTSGITHGLFGGVQGSGTGDSCAIAPLSLPTGVRVINVAARFGDESSAYDLGIGLDRDPIGAPPATQMVGLQPIGMPGNAGISTNSVVDPLVDATQFSYFLAVCGLSAETVLYDMTIVYKSS